MSHLNPNDPNVAMIERVAQRLGSELCKGLVFVGGAAAGLLITDMALPGIRRTDDVDVVTPAQALADYHLLETHLRALGFVEDMRPEAPICRWVVDGITVDMMLTKEEISWFYQPLVCLERGHRTGSNITERNHHQSYSRA